MNSKIQLFYDDRYTIPEVDAVPLKPSGYERLKRVKDKMLSFEPLTNEDYALIELSKHFPEDFKPTHRGLEVNTPKTQDIKVRVENLSVPTGQCLTKPAPLDKTVSIGDLTSSIKGFIEKETTLDGEERAKGSHISDRNVNITTRGSQPLSQEDDIVIEDTSRFVGRNEIPPRKLFDMTSKGSSSNRVLSVEMTDEIRGYLSSLSSAKEGQRLFCLKDQSESLVVDGSKNTIYFENKSVAKSTRDRLMTYYRFQTHLSKGPDKS